MLQDLREWFEFHACILAFIIVRFCGMYWLLVLAWKFFAREPLLYLYSAEGYTQETVPVMVSSAIQLISIGYQVLKRTTLGTAADSLVLVNLSPKIAAVSTLVFLMWSQSKPAPGASYLPLAALTAISIAGAIVVRWGPMSRDSARALALSKASVRTGEGSEQVTRAIRTKRTFADIHGHQQVKERLLLAGKAVVRTRKGNISEPVRNGILLHGTPGNGKTVFAEALAGELRLPLLTLSYSDIASKWVGEKTSRVRNAFEEALRQQPCVLFLDEVDSFLESRDAAGAGSVKEDRDLVNALLTLMVDIRQSQVVLVAATNHLDRLDTAAIREGRFDFKIEVPAPDHEARVGLLRHGLSALMPSARVDPAVIESVARRWNGYSTKRILAVVEELSNLLSGTGNTTPGFQDFMCALRSVQGRASTSLENVRPLAELVLSGRTRLGINDVFARMADPEHTEGHGGTLPTGILFAGPPGTGKTAAAKALAKELGWTYLPATGGELCRGTEALDRIHEKAKDLRPAIVFIDEADDLLRRREFSASTEATNKLLTILDGTGDRVSDVVWIAATNHLDQLDPAVLRGGRFTEKVVFELPSQQALESHMAAWFTRRKVGLEPSLFVQSLVEMLGEVSVANAEAVAQAAVNLAISRGATPVLVTRQDVLHAIQLVVG
jgi:transitional endoplasmic reticulum ATPase